jgi:3-oxoacyl-[acyl-carrier-protein] synthase II
MKGALDSAGMVPSDIDLIIAHGDGTMIGDKNESEAIHQVFSGCLDKVTVFSSKGALGHLLAGAPVVDVILGISMIRTGIVPPTPNAEPAEDAVLFHLVGRQSLPVHPNRILINCQSYEGQSASLVIESFS